MILGRRFSRCMSNGRDNIYAERVWEEVVSRKPSSGIDRIRARRNPAVSSRTHTSSLKGEPYRWKVHKTTKRCH